jgi:hypothetical protein
MTYTREELAKKFGDVLGSEGEFNNNPDDVSRLRDNKELKEAFLGAGRSESDWNDDVSMDNDIDFAFRQLGARDAKSKSPKVDEEPYQMSEELASAKAGVKAYEDHILPNQGDIIMGFDKNADGESSNRQSYLDAFSLNLKKNLEPVYADGSKRESKVEQEEEAVEGFE